MSDPTGVPERMTAEHVKALRSAFVGRWIEINGAPTCLGEILSNIEAQVSDDVVGVKRSEVEAVMLKLRKRANFADTIGDQNFLEGLRDELAGWLGDAP